MRKTISEAVSGIDDRHIEEMLAFRGKKKSFWATYGTAAACFCLVIAIVVFAVYRGFTAYTPPIYEHAYLSVEEVGNVFPMTKDTFGATSSYTKIYRPENRPLALEPLPTEDYADIYKIKQVSKPCSKTELASLADDVMPRLTAALGSSVSSFQKKEYNDDHLTISYRKNETLIDFEQRSGESNSGFEFSSNRIWIYNREMPIILNGKEIAIDQRQSEEEIIASLTWVRDALFEAFGRRFDSVEIRMEYNGTHEYGAGHIYVYYYDRSDGLHRGDYIALSFDNYANFADEVASADIIRKCSITYYAYRIPPRDYYSTEATCRLLSLEEAETLLKNGYVFGGHSCPLCMASQQSISFETYDAVGFEYVSNLHGDSTRAIPFYTFYKKIGQAQNGNIIYAKTYVCAVEVSGLAEYFKNQTSNH